MADPVYGSLLQYYVASQPNPLVTGRSAQITIQAANEYASAVTLTSIQVVLPPTVCIGGAPKLSGPAGWTGRFDANTCTFTASNPTIAAGQTLQFVLNDVPIAQTPSSGAVYIYETNPDNSQQYGALSLSAFPETFTLPTLYSDLTRVAPGTEVELKWSGPASCTFSLDAPGEAAIPPLTGNSGVVKVHPKVNTTYTLQGDFSDPRASAPIPFKVQYTITVDVPPPAITAFNVSLADGQDPTQSGMQLRFDWQASNASSIDIIQFADNAQVGDRVLHRVNDPDTTRSYACQVNTGVSALRFRLQANPLVGAESLGCTKEASFTVPAPRLLAYSAYVRSGELYLATGIQWAKQATILVGGADDSTRHITLEAPNGVHMTHVPKEHVFAATAAPAWSGLLMADAPDIQIVGLNGATISTATLIPANWGPDQSIAELRAAANFSCGAVLDPNTPVDTVHNALITGITDGIGSFINADARTSAVQTYQGLPYHDLMEQALVTRFLYLMKPDSAGDILLNEFGERVGTLWQWLRSKMADFPVEIDDTITRVAMAVTLAEQGGTLLYPAAESSVLDRSESPFLPPLRRPSWRLPTDRVFWLELQARDPGGQRLVLAVRPYDRAIVLANRDPHDLYQRWQLILTGDGADLPLAQRHYHFYNLGAGAYLSKDVTLNGTDLDWFMGTVQVGLSANVHNRDGNELNAYGDGPYVNGGQVGLWGGQGTNPNELWRIVELPDADNSVLPRGCTLGTNNSLVSPDGSSRLLMQSDGNLVLYHNGAPTWASGTSRGGDPNPPQADTVTLNSGTLQVHYSGTTLEWTGSGDERASSLGYDSQGNLVHLDLFGQILSYLK